MDAKRPLASHETSGLEIFRSAFRTPVPAGHTSPDTGTTKDHTAQGRSTADARGIHFSRMM